MKAISLHQPWASLCVTRQPLDSGSCGGCATLQHDVSYHEPMPMVKRFETRGWPCPPALIGQRIALHATKRKPDVEGAMRMSRLGGWWSEADGLGGYQMHADGTEQDHRLPLGAVVGSATIEACHPIIVGHFADDWTGPCIVSTPHDLFQYDALLRNGRDISDQLPYGDFTPGRFAWLLTDAVPTTERCPWCWGTGEALAANGLNVVCVCGGACRCDPIPARGRQRIWNWTPT